MSRDGWSDPDDGAPRKKKWPRWIVPLLISDAVFIALVLYWILGCEKSPDVPTNNGPAPHEVRGAPIDSAPGAAADEPNDDGFSDWDGSDGFDIDDDEVTGVPLNANAAAVSSGSTDRGALGSLLGGLQQVLPRPQITKPEHSDYTPASFEDIGNWRYQRNWSGPGAGASGPTEVIPSYVRKWHKRKIAILGFMQPLEITDDKRVTNFMLMRNQAACCYGAPITLADWIDIKPPAGQSYESMLHKPITVLGVLDVGEETIDGFTVSIFRMTPDKVLPPGESP